MDTRALNVVGAITVDSMGNATAMWGGLEGLRIRLSASRFDAADASWSEPVEADGVDRGSATGSPVLASNGSRQVGAAWAHGQVLGGAEPRARTWSARTGA